MLLILNLHFVLHIFWDFSIRLEFYWAGYIHVFLCYTRYLLEYIFLVLFVKYSMSLYFSYFVWYNDSCLKKSLNDYDTVQKLRNLIKILSHPLFGAESFFDLVPPRFAPHFPFPFLSLPWSWINNSYHLHNIHFTLHWLHIPWNSLLKA